MAKTIVSMFGVSRLDLINANNSKAFKDVAPDEQIHVTGAAIVDEIDENGNPRAFAYVFDNEAGAVYGGNAAGAVQTVSDLIPLMEEEPGEYYLSVTCSKSKGGKDYLSFFVSRK